MAHDTHDSQDDGPIATLNIVPFVDIVLVLLIIFMITSSAIAKASLKVQLPKAAAAGESVASTLNLVYTKDGALFLNGDPTTNDAVIAHLKRVLPDNPGLQAVISADKGVAYGDVVGLIDLVKTHGVATFALNIEKAATAGAQN